MSFPADNDAEHDTPSSPWMALESEETRRLHDSIVAAAELLKRDSGDVITQYATADRPFEGDFQLAGVQNACFELEPYRQKLPVLPTSMTSPSLADIDEWFSFGAMIKLGAVAGLAVGVALTTLNTVPPAGIATASQETRSPIFSIAALSGLAQIGSAQAKVQPDAAIVASASAVLAATPASIGIAKAPPTPAVAPMPTVAAIAPPAAAEVAPSHAMSAIAPPPPARAAVALAREEVAALMKRGRALLVAGDIPSARLILTRLADSGEAEASLLLAGTFDPAELARLHVIGAEPDIAQARAWYAKAADQGSPDGSRRLQQLARH
jgi:hypothetical protein